MSTITITSNEQAVKLIKDGVLEVDGDVEFICDISINAEINAGNIEAWNINARNINAGNISYYAVCFAYESFQCRTISGRRENRGNSSKHFCLDRDIVVTG